MTDDPADLIASLRALSSPRNFRDSAATKALAARAADTIEQLIGECQQSTSMSIFADLAPEALDEAARARGPEDLREGVVGAFETHTLRVGPDALTLITGADDDAFVTVYTDGACSRGGVGGWAWWQSPAAFDSGAEHFTTNNQMEMWAVIEAVKAFARDVPLRIVSDSAYVVSCMTERWFDRWREQGWRVKRGSSWKTVENRELWEELLAELDAHSAQVTWTHTRGHGRGDAEHKHGNDQADKLALAARLDFAAHHDSRHDPVDDSGGSQTI